MPPGAPTALHLGTLHPVEQALVLLVAFGPFVVLGFVVRRQRRRDLEGELPGPEQPQLSAGPARRRRPRPGGASPRG